jgi:hypothetical protein
MARPICPDARGHKYWNYIIVLMGRLKSAMLIDRLTETSLANETVSHADAMVELAKRHKALLIRQGRGEDSEIKPSKRRRRTAAG